MRINGKAIKTVNDFCYLGSFISDNCNCDEKIRLGLAKANLTFGCLVKIWANKGLSNLDCTRHQFCPHCIPRQAKEWMPNGRRMS